jgi:hypothetical protein
MYGSLPLVHLEDIAADYTGSLEEFLTTACRILCDNDIAGFGKWL